MAWKSEPSRSIRYRGLPAAIITAALSLTTHLSTAQPGYRESCIEPQPIPTDPQLRADIYRALVKGDAKHRLWASFQIISGHNGHARSVVRRALQVASDFPHCHHVRPMTAIIEDDGVDPITRSAAAISLGVIGRKSPCLFPGGGCKVGHNPLAAFTREALTSCLSDDRPVLLRRSCAEALGGAGIPSALSVLQTLLDNDAEDPVLRLHAARSCTLLTGTPCVTPVIRGQVAAFATQRIEKP